jgi:hypothetical protein
MAGNVRRLALDINPLIRLYLLFLAGMALLMDYDWCAFSPHLRPSLMPGFVFGIAASLMLQKMPVWRLLPVSKIEMDRARWWLGIGGPAIAVALVMMMAWALSRAMGHPGPAADSVVLVLAAQVGVNVALIFTQWFIFPLGAPLAGRWSILLLIPFMLVTFRVILLPRDHQALQQLVQGFAYGGVAAAALLYLCAGRWPAPMVGGLWGTGTKRQSVVAASQAPGPRGWGALLAGALPMLLMVWAGVLIVPAGIQLMTPDIDITIFSLIVTLLAAQISVTQLASAMRVLRALPLSGARLTLYLVLILIGVTLASLFVLLVGSNITGHHPGTLEAFVPLLCLPLLYFPSTLRFGFRFAQFGYAASLLVMLPLEFLPSLAPLSIVALVTAVLSAVGVAWSWWEITRGISAYRLQPMVAPRWRSV